MYFKATTKALVLLVLSALLLVPAHAARGLTSEVGPAACTMLDVQT
jgi:hypothetical protein